MNIDYSMILRQCGGDKRLVKEVIAILVKETPGYLEGIDRALEQNDFAAIAEIAHTLKGSLANFGAVEVSETTIALETAAKSANKKKVISETKLLRDNLAELFILLQNEDNFDR